MVPLWETYRSRSLVVGVHDSSTESTGPSGSRHWPAVVHVPSQSPHEVPHSGSGPHTRVPHEGTQLSSRQTPPSQRWSTPQSIATSAVPCWLHCATVSASAQLVDSGVHTSATQAALPSGPPHVSSQVVSA